jgi:hypothetical protein
MHRSQELKRCKIRNYLAKLYLFLNRLANHFDYKAFFGKLGK